uniref:Putative reverse transcriptase domain-containing protein n=1 Tax=Tanacetum cinerariifolium TaxID=118510 RepID=A0A699IIN3_TANCI|nr:putative reverse transcriptase domain-containing protein [Tanacetum cinerariifolium]
METKIATNVSKCSTCLRMKDDYQKPSDLLVQQKHPIGNGKNIAMYFITKQLSRVHITFHVSNLKKYLSDETLAIPLDEILVDEKLHFIKEPIEIMDREVKCLKQIHIPIVKVCWNSRRGPKFTWEREDQIQKKYPHLFSNSASVTGVTPDITYAVSVVSRYLANPCKNHWEVVKWILKYLRGTANVRLLFGKNRGNHVDITCFVDSDYAKDPNKGRFMTGYAFLVQGCVVSWKATLQHVVALSTTEAEYMALTEAVKKLFG